MSNEHVRNLFNMAGERRSVAFGVGRSAAGCGCLALSFACYTAWMMACCLGPAVAVPVPPGCLPLDAGAGAGLGSAAAVSVPAWAGPVLAMAASSVVIAARFRRTRRVPSGSSQLVALASIMTLAAALHLTWALDRSLPEVADAVLYGAASALTGIGAALFRVEIDRAFGWVGTQQTLYQGMLGVVAGTGLVACLVFPTGGGAESLVILQAGAVALPFAAAALLRRVVRGFPRRRYYRYGVDVPLPFPAKFVATSAVQGVAAGVLHAILFLFGASFAAVPALAIGQLIAVGLLFATLVFVRLDFNRFIYKVAFPFAAVGFLLLAAAPQVPWAGVTVLFAGFCYLDLVLWSLGACLMKNMGLPATWVASCPGAALFFGVLAGGAVTCVALGGHPREDAAMLAGFVACLLFACALFLSNGSNLKHGWGTVLPGEGGLEAGDLEGVVRFMATERAVTQRETEVMLLLAQGKSRRAICEALTVSPDTVKTHVRAVYRKLDVHSQQELVDRIVAERERLVDDAEEVALG